MAELLFDLKKIITVLVLPPVSPLLLILVGLLLRRRARAGLVLAWTGLILLTIVALPVTSRVLASLVIVPSGLGSEAASAAQAVVVLAGGRQLAPEYGGETVNALSLERLRYGARLAKERGLPLLLSGGVVYRGAPESALMDQALQQSFAMRARWLEQRSRDTHENALYSAVILKESAVHTVLLVTHDSHQRRSIAEFEAAGIRAVSAPVTMATPLGGSRRFFEQFPGTYALRINVMLLREILGNLALWMRWDAAPAKG